MANNKVKNLNLKSLEKLANTIRKETLILSHQAKHGHLGSSFSIIDLLSALYFWFLNIDPKNPTAQNRDRFILSKGHAAAALYVVLKIRGFFTSKNLITFLKDDTIFAGHTHHVVPGVEVSTGSLGHGLSVGVGMAYASKLDKRKNRTVVLLGDGECNEGSVWEAVLFAGHHKLDNLLAIVDYNKIQAFGRNKDVLNLEPFGKKWRAFNWGVKEINGHNFSEITTALKLMPFKKGKPSVIIAHTIKGKGVSFMEDTVAWHYWTPNDGHLKQALKDLNKKS